MCFPLPCRVTSWPIVFRLPCHTSASVFRETVTRSSNCYARLKPLREAQTVTRGSTRYASLKPLREAQTVTRGSNRYARLKTFSFFRSSSAGTEPWSKNGSEKDEDDGVVKEDAEEGQLVVAAEQPEEKVVTPVEEPRIASEIETRWV